MTQDSIAVLLGCVVCIIDGRSLVEVVQSNVGKMNAGMHDSLVPR